MLMTLISDGARSMIFEPENSAFCFAPLLRWVLTWWRSGRLALAVDPTLKGDQTTAIVISVLYRSCAIPVARIHRATQPGSWMDPKWNCSGNWPQQSPGI